MRSISLSELVVQSTQLISLPEIVIKLNNILSNPNSSTTDFAIQIQKDPALTVRLLKIINSPYYNFDYKISTIPTAVSIIGTRDLRDLVLTTSLADSLKGLKNPLCSLESYWRHAVYCGVIARKLAVLRRDRNEDKYFTAGLLHDIGSMILYQSLPEQSTSILQRAIQHEQSLSELEEDELGFNSSEVGAELIRSWNLSTMFEETIKYHNYPERSENFQVESTVIYIANKLANIIDMESNRLKRVEEIDEKYWDTINLEPEILNTARTEIVDEFNQITSLIISDATAA